EGDRLWASGAIEDHEPTRTSESIVVRGDLLEECKVLEPDEPGSTLDALPGQLGGNPEEDRHVRAKRPRFARPLQEANRILHDTFEARALVCVRRICVSIAQDEFSFLQMCP